jgi:nucleoside 2-deoxyribosyltransferase
MFREQPQAFVAVPDDPDNGALRSVVEQALDEAGVRAQRPDDDPARLAGGVQESIREADFVIADITGARPSVMVEVGMALGMGKRVLLLSHEKSSRLPVDLAAQQVAVYQRGDVGAVKRYLDLWLRDVMAERAAS